MLSEDFTSQKFGMWFMHPGSNFPEVAKFNHRSTAFMNSSSTDHKSLLFTQYFEAADVCKPFV
jgi:hypothetical protein